MTRIRPWTRMAMVAAVMSTVSLTSSLEAQQGGQRTRSHASPTRAPCREATTASRMVAV